MNESEYIAELEAYRKLCQQMSDTIKALAGIHDVKLAEHEQRLNRLEAVKH